MSERLATRAPASVRLAGVLIYVLALTYLLGLILAAFGFTAGGVWLAQRDDERASGLGAVGLVLALVVLVVLAILLWLTTRLRRGHGWARALVSLVLVVGAAAAVLQSWTELTGDPVVVPVVTVVRFLLMVAILALLWLPERAREHFAVGAR